MHPRSKESVVLGLGCVVRVKAGGLGPIQFIDAPGPHLGLCILPTGFRA